MFCLIHSDLRLQLLDTQHNYFLLKSLYGLLMLLPQSDAFTTLRHRLDCVPNGRILTEQIYRYLTNGNQFSMGLYCNWTWNDIKNDPNSNGTMRSVSGAMMSKAGLADMRGKCLRMLLVLSSCYYENNANLTYTPAWTMHFIKCQNLMKVLETWE